MLSFIKLVFFYCLLPASASGNERLLFVEQFFLWQSHMSIEVERCLCVSFGFTNDLGITLFELNLDVDEESWNRETIGSTNDCFLVFLGGTYIDMFDQVVEKVESIGKKLQTMARAIIINPQDVQKRNINETWPPLV